MGPQRCASSSSENMKAQTVLCLVLLIGLASSHSLSKRSLLKGSSHGHGHHQHHHQRRFQGRRQHQRQSATGSRRTGRDGDHHHEPHGEVRAISTGYLPADDYEDDLAGYGASSRSDNLPGYSGSEDYSDQSQYGSDQSQYGASERVSQPEYEETTTTAPDLARDADGESADDQYGAPSNIDNSYAAPDGEYGAPDSDSEGSGADESGVDVARSTDSDYSAPDTEYGSPDSSNSRSQLDGDYEAPAPNYSSGNGFPFEAVENSTGARYAGAGGGRQCPGGSIEECVAVCPGSTVRVYGACVGGCADRCPETV